MIENIISNEMLIDQFVSKEMENYFYIKLKEETDDYIKVKICELLKFLTLSHNTNGNIPFNAEIDEMWHLWILQTIQYQELMEKLPSKQFIHHCSNDYKDGREDEVCSETENNKEFSYLVSYVGNFGPFTKDTYKFWPLTNKLMDAMDIDLEALNSFLLNIFLKQAGK